MAFEVFLTFLVVEGRILIRTNIVGSGRPQNIRIRIHSTGCTHDSCWNTNDFSLNMAGVFLIQIIGGFLLAQFYSLQF